MDVLEDIPDLSIPAVLVKKAPSMSLETFYIIWKGAIYRTLVGIIILICILCTLHHYNEYPASPFPYCVKKYQLN